MPIAKTDEMTQKVGVDENGALWTKKIGSEAGTSNNGTYEETQLATGKINTDYKSGTIIKTKVTLEMLKSYKIFAVRWKGESNTSLNNTRLYLYDSDNNYITIDMINAGYEAIFEWADTEKTVLRPIQIFNGNSDYVPQIGTNFARTATSGNRLCSGQGIANQIYGWALVDNLPNSAEFALVSYSTPTITYSWEIRGIVI